jgi:hypothetical protein
MEVDPMDGSMKVHHIRIQQDSGKLVGDLNMGTESVKIRVELPLNKPEVATHMRALEQLLLEAAEASLLHRTRRRPNHRPSQHEPVKPADTAVPAFKTA